MPEKPLTEHELDDLKFMTRPDQWPYNPLLPVARATEDGETEHGTLLCMATGYYRFFPGVGITATPQEVKAALDNPSTSKSLLAPQLEDIIREGWYVD